MFKDEILGVILFLPRKQNTKKLYLLVRVKCSATQVLRMMNNLTHTKKDNITAHKDRSTRKNQGPAYIQLGRNGLCFVAILIVAQCCTLYDYD